MKGQQNQPRDITPEIKNKDKSFQREIDQLQENKNQIVFSIGIILGRDWPIVTLDIRWQ